jgi:hypothetical protein
LSVADTVGKPDVELAPSDDRLCQQFYEDNERQLREQRNLQATVDAHSEGKMRSTRATDKKSSKKSAKSSTPNAPNAVDAATDTADIHCQTTTVTDERTAICQDELNDLRQLVQTQQTAINKLQCHLEFLLSFLDIKATDIHSLDSTNQPNTQPTNNMQAAAAATKNTANDDVETWTQVVPQKSKRTDTLKQSVVAALYVDQTLKKRHETNLIVSGLPQSDSKSDSNLFAELCYDEFKAQPKITSTKRLGRTENGRIRPLLVVLQKAEEAKRIISSAKMLRQSTNITTRDTIYINAYMTRAEAAAAYQMREQRRKLQQRRNMQGSDARGDSDSCSVAPPTAGSKVSSAINSTPPESQITNSGSSSLNALAAPFGYQLTALGRVQSSTDTSLSLLTTAMNPNAMLPPLPGNIPASLNLQPTTTAPLATDHLQQQHQQRRHEPQTELRNEQ